MIIKKNTRKIINSKVIKSIIPHECASCGNWFVLEGLKFIRFYPTKAVEYYCGVCKDILKKDPLTGFMIPCIEIKDIKPEDIIPNKIKDSIIREYTDSIIREYTE